MRGLFCRLFVRAGLIGAVVAGLTGPVLAESVLTRGNGAEPATLDPHATDGRTESNILRDLFEGLVVYGPGGRIIPGVAESWDVSDDSLVYTFHLRENAKWSNGDPISAEDFVYSLRRAVAGHIGGDIAMNMSVIRNAEQVLKGAKPITELGVEAADPRTLRISLRGPTPYFLALLSSDTHAIPVHRASVEKYGANWAEPGKLVSNGAYQLTEWVPKQRVVVTRNPNYYGNSQVKIDKVVFLPISNAAEEVKLFRENKLDMTYEVPQDQVKWISLSDPKAFWNKPYIATYYYAFNLTAEPFKGNKALRKALTMAINREALVDKVTRAGELPAYSLVPPVVSGYKRQPLPFMEQTMDVRLEEARHLFAEAGYSPSQPLTLEVLYNTSDNNRKIANAIMDMWKDAFGKGMVVNAVNLDRNDYLQRRSRRQFQIVRAAWIGDYADPTVFLNLMKSEAAPPRNDAGFKSAAYDDLLGKAGTTNDPIERATYLQQAERLMLEEYAIIPIYHFATKSLVSPRVKGLVFNIRDVHPSRFLDVSN
ncbi:MAG: peptide ABC transporter substrate-binding protein [Rhodospirillaceae bacterium]